MNIWNKIEEIRQKPEHIRIRYVWFLVGVSMFFVVSLWILSILALKTNKSSEAGSVANETIQTLDQTQQGVGENVSGMKKSLEQVQDQVKNQNQNTSGQSQ